MNSSTFNFKMLRIAIVLISLFLVAEASFRYYYFGAAAIYKFWEYSPRGITISKFITADKNPKIGYQLSPNKQGLFKAAQLSVNALGFRGNESTVIKPKHTYRIASLGPSIAMGAGIADEHTYAQLLEDHLNRTFSFTIEIQNHAVGGYKALQIEESFWQTVEKFKPDLVLLPVYPRIFNNSPPFHELRDQSKLCLEIRCHLQNYFSLNALSYLARDFTRSLQKNSLFGNKRHWGSESTTKQTKNNKPLKNGVILKRFITNLKAAGYKVVILRLPTLATYTHRQQEKTNLSWQLWLNEVKPTLVIDTYHEIAPKISLNDSIYYGDNHPNTRVHSLYADAISPSLTSFIRKDFLDDKK
ncbi:MAG: SGNH/GDSL hydrolase family protein [Colwellia sp.]